MGREHSEQKKQQTKERNQNQQKTTSFLSRKQGFSRNRVLGIMSAIGITIFGILLIFGVLIVLPISTVFLCVSPFAEKLIWATVLMLILHILLFIGIIPKFSFSAPVISGSLNEKDVSKLSSLLKTQDLFSNPQLAFIVFLLIIGLIYFLGSYTFSPLQIANEDPPFFEGFSIKSSGNEQGLVVASNGSIDIDLNSIVRLTGTSGNQNVHCQWSSANNGNLQTPDKCSTNYSAPLAADHDVIELRMLSACKTKESITHLIVNFLP